MTKTHLLLFATFVGWLAAMPVANAAFAIGRCIISDDKLTVVVRSGSSDEDSYQCQVTCRTRVEGQRAFEMVQCAYGLKLGAKERVVCEVKAK